MQRLLVPVLGVATVLALITGPVVYAFHEERQMRNFRIVREGVLYRSARLTVPGLKRAVNDYGIRTVVSLRNPDGADLEEEAFCQKEEINFYRLPPKPWASDYGPPEAEVNVRQFLQILDDPDNFPILVHCFAGIHRTGAYVAIYRIECEKWSNDAAIAEVKELGYDHLDDELDVLGYLEHYRPTWKQSAEPPNAGPKVPGHPRRKKVQ